MSVDQFIQHNATPVLSRNKLERARQEAVLARHELGETIERLSQRLDVKTRMQQKARRMASRATGLGKSKGVRLAVVGLGLAGAVACYLAWRKKS